MAHDWPGNIRELENVIERSFILADKGVIDVRQLPEELTSARAGEWAAVSGMKNIRNMIDAQSIRSALERNDNNRLAAARELGIHKSTLFRKMKKLGVPLPAEDGRKNRSPKQ